MFFDDKYEGVDAKIVAVDKWIDEQYGFFSYFGIRSLVKSALDNTLKQDYPNCPFIARDVILWAKWNDEESLLMTAGGQAIEGEAFADYLMGAPAVDPLTGERNSIADQNGIVKEFANSTANTLFKAGFVIGIGFLIFKYAGAKASALGGK